MNVLVANISTFSQSAETITYHVNVGNCSVSEFTARHTNESVYKCLSHMNDVLSSGGIGKIIVLVSSLVVTKKDERFGGITAFDYYRKVVKEDSSSDPNWEIVPVEDDDRIPRPIHSIIDDVCKRIDIDDVVYIDAAGGQRTINNAIQLLTKMLKYKGIKNPYSLYSNIQSKQGFIENTDSFDQLVKLTEAFNEFMTTGKSDQLQECVGLSDPIYRRLIESMCEISDRIQIGNLVGLENAILQLRSSLTECEAHMSEDMACTVTKHFLPVIRQKLLGDEKTTNVDYCSLVRWCLNNGFIQQALTIFVEKIPISLFDRGIIKYNGNLSEYIKECNEKSANNPLISADWQPFAFYTEIISSKQVSGEQIIIDDFKECLRTGSPSSRATVSTYLMIVKKYANGTPDRKFQAQNELLEKWKREGNYRDSKSFLNSIWNNSKKIAELFGYSLPDESKGSTLDEKFGFVKKVVEKSLRKKGNFIFNTSNIGEIMYAYLYVKSVRNTANHASSEENLSEKQKNTLRDLGYDFEMNNLRTIRENIIHALESIENAEVKNI